MGAINTIVNDDGYLRGYKPTARVIFAPLKRAVLISKANDGAIRGRWCLNGNWRAGGNEGLKEIKLFNRRDEFFDKALPSRSGLTKTPIAS